MHSRATSQCVCDMGMFASSLGFGATATAYGGQPSLGLYTGGSTGGTRDEWSVAGGSGGGGTGGTGGASVRQAAEEKQPPQQQREFFEPVQ
jgi:hypothetical protein